MADAAASWQLNPEHSGIEILFTEKPADEVLAALRDAGFRWHRQNKLWYHRDTLEARTLAQKIANFEEIPRQQQTAARKKAKIGPKCLDHGQILGEPAHELKESDILYTSWGWEQTNVEWFQIVEILGKQYFMIQEIGSKSVEGSEGFMSDSCLPVPERILEKGPVKGFCNAKGFMHVVERSYQRSLFLWDGKSKQRSWYG